MTNAQIIGAIILLVLVSPLPEMVIKLVRKKIKNRSLKGMSEAEEMPLRVRGEKNSVD